MAASSKNGKSTVAASPKAKTAEKAPAAPAKAAAPVAAAKPVAAPAPAPAKPAAAAVTPAAKPAAPAPAPAKPAETKPAPAPAPKAEAKQPAKPAARVAFGAGWTQTVEGELVSGGQLTLSYDPSRAKLQHKNGEKPAWGVQAYVKLIPSGQVVEQPAVDFAGASAKARPVTLDIPKGTTEIQVWFKNWAAAGQPGEAWDSNFGLNYKFAVRP